MTYMSLRASIAPVLHTLRIFTNGPINQELIKGIPASNFPSLKRIIVFGGHEGMK